MTPERWRQVKAVLARALETEPAERGPYVDLACAGDAELHAEITSLLLAASGDGDSVSGVRRAVAAATRSALGGLPDSVSLVREPADRDRALHALLETALGQQYEIVRPLGHGGMGSVYLARERALERFVAIKVLRPDLADAPDSRERFRREARTAAQLSHPGILPLHTFGEVRGTWYFVMGYVGGTTLAERLRVEGRLPGAEAHRILAELADALECAHRHGVVHRDIKPANVLLDDETGRAVLADFGISKVQGASDSLTATGVVVGTPHYMSPEQSLGAATVDERSDIYSLGAVGYAMLAGREPFAGTGDPTHRRLSGGPAPLHTVAPSVPHDLAGAVMRCLERDPALRWPDARSLKGALVRAGGDANVAALPESLRDLPTFGPYALLWAAFWATLAARSLHSPGDRTLLLLIALIVPVGFAFHLWNVGRHGLGVLGLTRVAFWPPEWWGMWWPRALRRPTDLWPRLPWPARMVRAVLSAFTVALPVLILTRGRLEATVRLSPDGPGREWFATLEAALVLGAAVATAGALWWAHGRGLPVAKAVRVLFGATTPSPGWRTPDVARLLAPTAGLGVRPPDPAVPADHRRAIAELAPLLPPPAASLGARAVEMARRTLAAIEACDAEVAALSRDASAGELDRLTAQVAALEEEVPSASLAERRELLALVRSQLSVVRRMRLRCELVSQRRTRLFTLLRGLWTQLCLVRDTAADDPLVTGTVSDRVRALSDEIGRELERPDVPATTEARHAPAPVWPGVR